MPRVLIDTTTGRLLDKAQQALAFEELPIHSEFVSSMTTRLDLARIRGEVQGYYVTPSHKREHIPSFLQKVETNSVYELEAPPENSKLHMFCTIVRSLAEWSDTFCVGKTNNVVLQKFFFGCHVHLVSSLIARSFNSAVSRRGPESTVIYEKISGALVLGHTLHHYHVLSIGVSQRIVCMSYRVAWMYRLLI